MLTVKSDIGSTQSEGSMPEAWVGPLSEPYGYGVYIGYGEMGFWG